MAITDLWQMLLRTPPNARFANLAAESVSPTLRYFLQKSGC